MKLNLSLLLTLFIFTSSLGQDKAIDSHYVFSVFTPGEVLMKNGVKNSVVINYNSLSEEMVFESNGGKLAIADQQLQEIDTVFIRDRKFVRREHKFLELILQSSVDVYVEYRCRIKYPGKVNGPGGRTSQTSSSETYQPTDFRRVIYEVVLPTGYDTNPYMYYWIEKNGVLKKFKNLNQLMKLYSAKKNLFKAHVKKYDVDYQNQEHITALIQYLEQDQND